MLRAFRTLVDDEAGFIISAELATVTTIAVLGMVVGLTVVRDTVTNELNDIADAFDAVSQTYHVDGLTTNCNRWNDIAHTFGTVSQTYHVVGRTNNGNNCNDCNDIAHTFSTVSQTDHVVGRTNNGNKWRAYASINGFGFNDDDECDMNDPIHGDDD